MQIARQCLSCHNPISEKRLAALPNATLCVTCQESVGVQVIREPASDIRRLFSPRKTVRHLDVPVRKRTHSFTTSGLSGAAFASGF